MQIFLAASIHAKSGTGQFVHWLQKFSVKSMSGLRNIETAMGITIIRQYEVPFSAARSVLLEAVYMKGLYEVQEVISLNIL